MIVNPFIWYAERELKFVPPHFIKCPTPVNPQSKQWIENKITGRYSIIQDPKSDDNFCVYFEDQKDATFYELVWVGSTK